jgi:hypothetical protein
MRPFRPALVGIVALLQAGCSEDPRRAQTLQYLMDMRPVVYENGLLAEQVMHQGASVYDGRSTPEGLLAAWDGEIIPLAQHVHDLASTVEPPGNVAPDHRALTELWKRRHRVYRNLSEAAHRADLDAFQNAQRESAAVTLEEDQWVRAFNAKLQPMELFVDLVP